MKLTKVQTITLIISSVLGVAMIGGAVVYSKKKAGNTGSHTSSETVKRPVSKDELAKADGKNGNDCLVAVDGTVYQIKDFSLWNNQGQHVSSQGMAYCGADLSAVIDKAPHGRKMLDILIEVGPLSS